MNNKKFDNLETFKKIALMINDTCKILNDLLIENLKEKKEHPETFKCTIYRKNIYEKLLSKYNKNFTSQFRLPIDVLIELALYRIYNDNTLNILSILLQIRYFNHLCRSYVIRYRIVPIEGAMQLFAKLHEDYKNLFSLEVIYDE